VVQDISDRLLDEFWVGREDVVIGAPGTHEPAAVPDSGH
jgi:hypothetical protein